MEIAPPLASAFPDFSILLYMLLALAGAVPLGAFTLYAAVRGRPWARILSGLLGLFIAALAGLFLFILPGVDAIFRGAMIGAIVLGVGLVVAAIRLRPPAI